MTEIKKEKGNILEKLGAEVLSNRDRGATVVSPPFLCPRFKGWFLEEVHA